MVNEQNDSKENLNFKKGRSENIALSEQVIAEKHECFLT